MSEAPVTDLTADRSHREPPRLVAERLGKRYHRPARPRARTWRELLTRPWRPSPAESFWALRDVSLELHAGEMIGVIGPNGAGKSTLLHLLGGIGRATEGRVRAHGRIGALLELGGAFVGDLTGRENAIMAGVMAGLTRAELLARLDEIVAFAELESFMDQPVRTYSTGMAMRLAFSVAIHTEPDVLLIDEFLSVGDLAFQAKCRARIREMRDGGCAIVFVSHGIDQVREMCDRVLWLRQGAVAAFDAPDIVTELYEAEMREASLRRTPDVAPVAVPGGRKLRARQNRFGSLEVRITRVTLRPGRSIRSGDPLEVTIQFDSEQPVTRPVFVVSITREDGTLCLDTNTQGARADLPDICGRGEIVFRADRVDLGAGRYYVNVGVFEAQWSHAYDYHWHVYPLTVDGGGGHKGLLAPPCRWALDVSPSSRPLARVISPVAR